MARRLFTLLSALSLLLCAAVCVLWVRSEAGVGESVRFNMGGRGFTLASTDGMLLVTSSDARAGGEASAGFRYSRENSIMFAFWVLLRTQPDAGPSLAGRMGFGWLRGPVSWTALAPHWAAALPLAVLPAWRSSGALARHRRRRRARHGLCPTCGYDLRATPGRCPECGAAAAGTKT